jgi:IS4 transposase
MAIRVKQRGLAVHVVVFSDFDYRKGAIIDLFRLSEEHAHQARYLAQQMAEDLLKDVAELRRELNDIEAFCKRKLQRPYPKE